MSANPLPAGWVELPLGDLLAIRYGKALPKGDRAATGFPYVASAGAVACSRVPLVEEDALIIGRKGNVGSVQLVRGGVWPSDTTFCLVPPPSVDIQLLRHQLVSLDLARGDQSTALPGLPRGYLEATRVRMAPQQEQPRILHELERRLSHVDAAERGLKKALVQVAQARSSIMSNALRGGLGLNLDSEGWRSTTLGDAFGVFVGRTPSRSRADFWGGDVAWVSSGEVAWCRIQSTREAVTAAAGVRVHPPGTVMLGMIGEGRTRGQAAILDLEAAHNQNCAAIRVSETENLPEWIYYQLQHNYERTRAGGSGNNQQALNKRLVQAIPVVLPDPDVQRRLVAELDRRMSILAATQRSILVQLARCKQARRAVLAAAFTGRLVEQRPEEQPARQMLERIAAEREARTTRKRSQVRKMKEKSA